MKEYRGLKQYPSTFLILEKNVLEEDHLCKIQKKGETSSDKETIQISKLFLMEVSTSRDRKSTNVQKI